MDESKHLEEVFNALWDELNNEQKKAIFYTMKSAVDACVKAASRHYIAGVAYGALVATCFMGGVGFSRKLRKTRNNTSPNKNEDTDSE